MKYTGEYQRIKSMSVILSTVRVSVSKAFGQDFNSKCKNTMSYKLYNL